MGKKKTVNGEELSRDEIKQLKLMEKAEKKARKKLEKEAKEAEKVPAPQEQNEKSKKKPAGKKKMLESSQSFSPILGVKDGIIATKDGHYAKLMEFTPINFELRSPSEQDDIISAFSAAIKTMPGKVHLKIMNTPSDVSPFLKDLYKCMENENVQSCRELQFDQMQLINRIGKTQGVSRKFFLSFQYEEPTGFNKAPKLKDIKAILDRNARSVAASMDTCGNQQIVYDEDEDLIATLYTIMNKSAAEEKSFEEYKDEIIRRYSKQLGRPVDAAEIPINDFLAPQKIDFSYNPGYLKIDNKYVMYCFIPSSAYPTRAYGGWLQVLFSYFEGVDVDLWISKENVANIQRRLSFELKTNRVKERNTEDISMDYEDIEAAIASGYYIKNQLASGDDFCYFATMLTISGNTVDEMMARYRDMHDHLVRNDMSIRRCIFQQKEAYLATLPFATYDKNLFKKSRRNIMSSQLGSCYPFTAYELCDKDGIFFGINTQYGSPVFINLFDQSLYLNSNAVILGPSGSGKSYCLMTMLLRMRQKGIQVFVIAPFKGEEFERACRAVGGEFVRISPGSRQNINILEIRRSEASTVMVDGVEYGSTGSILADKIQQVETFFSLLLKDMKTEEKQILDDALVKTYAKFHITMNNKTLREAIANGSGRMPTLGDLYSQLATYGDSSIRLRDSMAQYVTGSAKSFNMPTNVDLKNKFVVLDVSSLTKEMLAVGMFIALDFVMDEVKKDKTKNKVVAIDELWRLMVASQQTREFALETYKIIRGYGGSCISATQDLSDIIRDEYGSAIINNAKIKFFFPADKREVDEITNVIDLTSEEVNQLKASKTAKAGTKRKILLIANTNHVFISVVTSQKEHNLITTNPDDLRKLSSANALDF